VLSFHGELKFLKKKKNKDKLSRDIMRSVPDLKHVGVLKLDILASKLEIGGLFASRESVRCCSFLLRCRKCIVALCRYR